MTIEEYLQTPRGRSISNQIKGIKTLPDAFINHLDEYPDLLELQQVANFLGLTKQTILVHIKEGFLKEKDGFVVKQSLIQWLSVI